MLVQIEDSFMANPSKWSWMVDFAAEKDFKPPADGSGEFVSESIVVEQRMDLSKKMSRT